MQEMKGNLSSILPAGKWTSQQQAGCWCRRRSTPKRIVRLVKTPKVCLVWLQDLRINLSTGHWSFLDWPLPIQMGLIPSLHGICQLLHSGPEEYFTRHTGKWCSPSAEMMNWMGFKMGYRTPSLSPHRENFLKMEPTQKRQIPDQGQVTPRTWVQSCLRLPSIFSYFNR